MYVSTNAGLTWAVIGSLTNGLFATSELIAVDANNRLYSMALPLNQTTTGINGYIVGSQYATIGLQYIGNNTFNILSSEGSPVPY